MRVIQRGDEKEHEITCSNCRSDIAYTSKDYRTCTVTIERWDARMEGKPQTTSKTREVIDYIWCPVCGSKIYLPSVGQLFVKSITEY